jgi:dolichyl-phosphate-mannose-protein mannosyltransferase
MVQKIIYPGIVFLGISLNILIKKFAWISGLQGARNDFALPWIELFTLVPACLALAFLISKASNDRNLWLKKLENEKKVIRLMLAFLVTAALIICWGAFQGIPHAAEETGLLFQAKIFSAGKIKMPAPAHYDSFHYMSVFVQDGYWYGRYPFGFSVVLAGGLLMSMSWLINPIIGALNILVLIAIGAKMFDRPTGLLAGFLLLLSPFHLTMSSTIMSHPSCLLLLSLYFLLLWDTADNAGLKKRLLKAGLVWALAFNFRPFDSIIFAIAVMFALVFYQGKLNRVSIGPFKYLLITMACGPLIYVFYILMRTGSFMIIDFSHIFPYSINGPRSMGSFADSFSGLFKNLLVLNRDLYGWPFSSLLIMLIPFIKRRISRIDICLMIIIVIYTVCTVIFGIRQLTYGAESFYVILPFMILLTVRGLRELACGWPYRGRQDLPNLELMLPRRNGIIIFTLILFVIGGINYWPEKWNCLADDYNGVSRKINTAAMALKEPALCFIPDEYNYTNGLAFMSPRLDDDIIYARDLGYMLNRNAAALFPGHSEFQVRKDDGGNFVFIRGMDWDGREQD